MINIVTKTASGAPFSGRVEGAVGSYGFGEGRVSAAPRRGLVVGHLRQRGDVARLSTEQPVEPAECRRQSELPKPRVDRVFEHHRRLPRPKSSRHSAKSAAGLSDHARYPARLGHALRLGAQTGFGVTAGFTRTLGSGADLIVDGGVRRKFQQGQFFNYFNNPFFSFDPSTAAPANYVNTVMTTSSVTPRIDMRHQLFGVPNRLLTGIDFYNTQYDSDRPQAEGLPDIHRYSIRQTTASIYAMNTTTVTPALEISYGGRSATQFRQRPGRLQPGRRSQCRFLCQRSAGGSRRQQRMAVCFASRI